MPTLKAMAVNVREDGPLVVAYLAHPETLEESELLAAVNRYAFGSDAHIREAFKVFIKAMATRLVVQVTGDEDSASKMDIQEFPSTPKEAAP